MRKKVGKKGTKIEDREEEKLIKKGHEEVKCLQRLKPENELRKD